MQNLSKSSLSTEGRLAGLNIDIHQLKTKMTDPIHGISLIGTHHLRNLIFKEGGCCALLKVKSQICSKTAVFINNVSQELLI